MDGIQWGGVVFDGTAADTTFTLAEYGGFDLGGVDVRRDSPDRPQAHGAFIQSDFLTGRLSWWKGLVLTDSEPAQRHAIARLNGLGAEGKTTRLTILGHDLWCDVQRDGAPRTEVLVPGKVASYRLQVWAGDPRIYGPAREFAAGVAAVHYGNFPATPVHEVTGPTSGYTITGPDGKKFMVSSGPGSGVDRIDMASGRVYRNGSLLLGAVTRADLWTIPPGAPGVTHAISAGVLTTTVTDTFV